MSARDDTLEKAIDEVGREKVFSYVRANGWGNSIPPKWVWWQAIASLATRPRDEGED